MPMPLILQPSKSAAEQAVETALNAEQRNELLKISRFLQNIDIPKIAARALMRGYDADEHQEGWNLFWRASGANRPFTQFVDQTIQAALLSDDKTRAAVRSLDAFENDWFPMVETVLQRFIKGDNAKAFITGFFTDLTQQPEGPGVLRSVSVLLDRVAELATDKTPGAKEAHAALVKRGLNAETVQLARDLISQIKKFTPTSPIDSAAAIAQANADQRAAFEALVLWHRDWARSLENVLDYHSLVRLGLVKRKGGHVPPTTST
jgi:hypothetical protein